MTTPATPFGTAAAGRANPAVAVGAMSTSSKLMTVLAFASVFSILLIAVFVMNIMWAPGACDKKTEDNTEGEDGRVEEEKKSSGTTKGAAIRNYIGVTLSSIMLMTLVPGFYFVNAM